MVYNPGFFVIGTQNPSFIGEHDPNPFFQGQAAEAPNQPTIIENGLSFSQALNQLAPEQLEVLFAEMSTQLEQTTLSHGRARIPHA